MKSLSFLALISIFLALPGSVNAQCSGGSCSASSGNSAVFGGLFRRSVVQWPVYPSIPSLPNWGGQQAFTGLYSVPVQSTVVSQSSSPGWHWAYSGGRNIQVYGYQLSDGSVYALYHPFNTGRF